MHLVISDDQFVTAAKSTYLLTISAAEVVHLEPLHVGSAPLICGGPDSLRRRPAGCLTEVARERHSLGAVSLNLARDGHSLSCVSFNLARHSHSLGGCPFAAPIAARARLTR
jgi:hypothetical protein